MEPVRVGRIVIVQDVQFTAMQQAEIMDQNIRPVDMVVNHLSIVRIIWLYPLALLLSNTFCHSLLQMYLLRHVPILTTSTHTTPESWDQQMVSRQMQHYNMELYSLNPLNAVMVDVNVNQEPVLAKRTAVDVVSDVLVRKMLKVIRI